VKENGMSRRFDGRVALVTGAAAGIGRATALRLAAEGARLGLTDLRAEELRQVAEEVRAAGGEAVEVAGDVTEAATTRGLVAAAEERFGRVDALVNNVGVLVLTSLLDTTAEDFDRLMRVNCYSHLLAIQAAVPAMRRAGGGAVVNVASVGALVALPNVSAYCPSKSAVLGLTRAAAAEFGPDIRVNAVCPGGVETEMSRVHLLSFEDKEAASRKLTGRQMIPRYAQPAEIAAVIAFLASDDASFVTGAAVAADAGHSAW
jgi:NAD(P)-dependent dehydrogenase (short-subunit alcohol dehydrogenase family)